MPARVIVTVDPLEAALRTLAAGADFALDRLQELLADARAVKQLVDRIDDLELQILAARRPGDALGAKLAAAQQPLAEIRKAAG